MLPQERLNSLKRKHASLSALIEREQMRPGVNETYLKQLKAQKLLIKDEIELSGEEKKGRLLA